MKNISKHYFFSGMIGIIVIISTIYCYSNLSEAKKSFVPRLKKIVAKEQFPASAFQSGRMAFITGEDLNTIVKSEAFEDKQKYIIIYGDLIEKMYFWNGGEGNIHTEHGMILIEISDLKNEYPELVFVYEIPHSYSSASQIKTVKVATKD